MNVKNIELKLLHGSPIEIFNLGNLTPLKLSEIEAIGESEYNKYIFTATYRHPEEVYIEGYKLSDFGVIWMYCYHEEDFRNAFFDAMETFFKKPIFQHRDGFFYFGDLSDGKYLSENNYADVVSIIRKQNFIQDKEIQDNNFNPKNERAKELAEKLKKFRQKVKEKNKENGLDLSDIISIVSTHSQNINIFNIWDLTVYQLYTIYIRLIMKDSYDSNFYLLPHVSDSSSLDLTHWASKIKYNID